MSTFNDVFNPCLNYEILKIIPTRKLHNQLRKCTKSRTATALLHAAHDLLAQKVHRLEYSYGIYDTRSVHALDILGAVQSELNLHVKAAATYRKIVTIDDMQEYLSLPIPSQFTLYQPLKPQCRYQRNLEALFNLALQLNKSFNHIEAEVALRRLIPLAKAKYGLNSFQYRNSIEQLIYALSGQGCKEGVEELFTEYRRSQDDEIKEMSRLQRPEDDDDQNGYDMTDIGLGIEMDFETESELELDTPPPFYLDNEPPLCLQSTATCSTDVKARSPDLHLLTNSSPGRSTDGLIAV